MRMLYLLAALLLGAPLSAQMAPPLMTPGQAKQVIAMWKSSHDGTQLACLDGHVTHDPYQIVVDSVREESLTLGCHGSLGVLRLTPREPKNFEELAQLQGQIADVLAQRPDLLLAGGVFGFKKVYVEEVNGEVELPILYFGQRYVPQPSPERGEPQL